MHNICISLRINAIKTSSSSTFFTLNYVRFSSKNVCNLGNYKDLPLARCLLTISADFSSLNNKLIQVALFSRSKPRNLQI